MGKKIFLIFVGILIPLSIAFAAWTDLEIDWPPSPMGTDLTTASTLTELSRYLYEWGIALGGLAAFIALLIAGFLYLTSVGDPQKLADARGRIIWALAGLVLLLAAWLILNTINPDLTRPNLEELLPGCDTDADCPPDYICIGDKNPGDGDPEGICVAKVGSEAYRTGGKPYCSYAIIFEKENFGPSGETKILNFGDNGYLGILFGTKNIGSVKSFYDDATIDNFCGSATSGTCTAKSPECHWNPGKNYCYRDCGPDACGCFVELYDCYGSGLILPCLGMIEIISAHSQDLFWYQTETKCPPFPSDGKTDCIILRKGYYSY